MLICRTSGPFLGGVGGGTDIPLTPDSVAGTGRGQNHASASGLPEVQTSSMGRSWTHVQQLALHCTGHLSFLGSVSRRSRGAKVREFLKVVGRQISHHALGSLHRSDHLPLLVVVALSLFVPYQGLSQSEYMIAETLSSCSGT